MRVLTRNESIGGDWVFEHILLGSEALDMDESCSTVA